jgi:hypothetical protein
MAQTETLPAPPPSRFQFHIGQLTVNPTIGLTNIGVDQNVFNEPSDLNPKSDFTFTVAPAVDLRYRLLRTQLTGSVREDLVWYQTYSSERAANTNLNAGWLIPFNRVSFKVNARHLNVRDRPGYEIDARSQRVETEYGGSVEVRVAPKTFVGLAAQRLRLDYDKAAVFLGSSLQNELNRVTTSEELTLRYKLTPITSVSLVATRAEDRFEFSSLRDSNSTSASAVIAFDPLGILSGQATVGYTFYQPQTPGLPNYDGPTGAVDVSYRLLGTMKITVGANRGVDYSYDVTQPYYLATGVDGSVSRAIKGPVDAVVRAGYETLAYRNRFGIVVAVSNRVDTVTSFGAGLGYHMGGGTRIGFNVDTYHRVSDVSFRQYDDLRIGSSVTYGF